MEEQRSALEISPKRVYKIWNQWQLRVMVLLSLALQIMLIIFGDRRRRRSNWARLLVWLMYLSADSVATIALGILFNNEQQDITSSSGKSADPQSVIVSVWASFLILHLGGPDTITAYSLEDNDLWLRHLLGLAVQVGGAIYVILMSQIVHTDHHLELMFLVMPIFVAGFIKYGERTWALRSASRMRLANALYKAPSLQDFVTNTRIRDLKLEIAIIHDLEQQSARIRDLEQEIARIREQQSARIRDLEPKIAIIRDLEQQSAIIRDLEQQSARIRDLEQEIARIRDLEEQSARIRDLEQEIAIIREQQSGGIRDLEQEIARIREQQSARICDLEQEIARIREQQSARIRVLEQEIARIREQQSARIRDLEQEIATFREQQSAIIRDLEQEIATIREQQSARICDLEQEIARIREQQSARIRVLEQEIARIRKQQSARIRDLVQLNDKIRRGRVDRGDAISGSYHLREAFTLFEFLRDAYGDVPLDEEDRDESHQILWRKSAEEAFRLVDIELGFLYDMIYTKAPIIWYNKFGFFLRIIAFLSSLSALLMFCLIIDKKPYSNIDTSITYLFAFGAVFLEIYSLILLIISDWNLIILSDSEEQWAKRVVYRAISSTWLASINDRKIRWSGSIGQFNLFEFAAESPSMFDPVLERIGIYDLLLKNRYTTWEKVSAELKLLVFQQLRKSREKAEHPNDMVKISSRRGDEVLRKNGCLDKFDWSIVDAEFDYSIIVWHIATNLCYDARCKGDSNSSLDSKCKMSKLLSDYMIYLLYVNASMLPMGNGLRTFLQAWLYATRFETETGESINRNGRKIRKKVLYDIDTAISPCPSLNDGYRLARGLQSLETDGKKWEMISEVWVEMLCYAACRCEWKDHATQLRRGGDFLTHVAVIMFHLGFTSGKSQKSNIISQ